MIAEPYPAVIMPSGSGSMDIQNNQYQFTHYRIFGETPQGEFEPIDPLQLIGKAHRQYLYAIFKNGYGLKTESTRQLKLRGTDWVLYSYQQKGNSVENQQSYKRELADKLQHKYQTLHLQQLTVTGDLKTNQWIEEVVDESIAINL